MDTVLKIFVILGSGAALLLYTFLLGVLFGIVLWRWFRKRVPIKYQGVVDEVDSLEQELDKTAGTVAEVWATRPVTSSPKPSAQVVCAINQEEEGTEPIHPLITRIINLKKRLAGLRKDLDSVIPWLAENSHSEVPPENRPLSDQDKTTQDLASDHTNKRIVPKVIDAHKEPRLGVSGDPRRKSGTKASKVRGMRTTAPFGVTNVAAEIAALYNRALTDTLARERLREEYQPIRVGTVNAVERRQNPTIKAEFRETTDGDFFAFRIPGRNEYVVVPRLGVTIEAVSYTAGALGEVFDKTQGHDPKLFYSHYRVEEPAIFEREGECWELLEAGELDLGLGD